jgi:hypothetical protein
MRRITAADAATIAANTNARVHPAVSALRTTSCVSGPVASVAFVRVAAIVASAASPIARPTWRLVCKTPDTIPA